MAIAEARKARSALTRRAVMGSEECVLHRRHVKTVADWKSEVDIEVGRLRYPDQFRRARSRWSKGPQ